MSKEIVPLDKPYSIIQIPREDFNNLQYFKAEVDRLNNVIKGYKKLVNEAIEIKKYNKALEGFRKMVLLNCIVKNKLITPFQCRNFIVTDECTFENHCNPRKEFLKKVLTKMV